MWNMQLWIVHCLFISNFWHLQNSASSGTKTSVWNQKWLNFQSPLLNFKDIEHWKPPKHAPCKVAYFTYQAVNFLINIGGLNWANHMAKHRIQTASSRVSWNRYSRNSPKMEPLLTRIIAGQIVWIKAWLTGFCSHWGGEELVARYTFGFNDWLTSMFCTTIILHLL